MRDTDKDYLNPNKLYAPFKWENDQLTTTRKKGGAAQKG
jgi:hypothetical protein